MAADDPRPRGSWNLDEAVRRRWLDADLDTIVRNEWPKADRLNQQYNPLHDQMARPVPPGAYVVYEKSIPIVVGHMTGSTGVNRENQFQRIGIQFRVHAKDRVKATGIEAESAKSICIRVAKEVSAAFDPNTMPWTIYDDSIASVIRGPDFHTHEGEEEYVWVIQYDVLIDAEYLTK